MIGYIDDQGKYQQGVEDVPMPHNVDNQYKSYSHSEQRKRHAKDILQPYVDGKPNRDFVQAYDGDVSKRYFDIDTIIKSERKLS